jgi:hypothetical protein
VRVLPEDRASKGVLANALINPLTEDVIISDALAEELGIQILYPRRGIWKFSDEESQKQRITNTSKRTLGICKLHSTKITG